MATNSLLMAIVDPLSDEQTALKRATRLAAEGGHRIHAFCCTYLNEAQMASASSRQDAKHQELKRVEQWLRGLADPIAEQGIAISTEAYWNQHWRQSACHAAARHGAQMLIKNHQPERRPSHNWSPSDDGQLLRDTPCPVLLTRSNDDWINGRILAALAISPEDNPHEQLNNHIIAAAQRLNRSNQSELHLVAAATPRAELAIALNAEDDAIEQLLAERCGVSPAQVHIDSNPAREAIVTCAERIGADVLVIGTMARKGLRGAILGNTAEKVLDQLSIDILVVN